MNSTFSLAGHNAIITGGTRGIGLAIAGGFLEAGATVTLCRADRIREIGSQLSVGYEQETGHHPQLFATRPVQVARLL